MGFYITYFFLREHHILGAADMKQLVILCCLCFYVTSLTAKEIELISDVYPSGSIKITLPDKNVLTLADFPLNITAPVVEINKKIPELTLPPRGKGIDISGVYQCKEDNSLFSVHHYDDRLVLINISRNADFLEKIGVVSKIDVQNTFSYPIEKFTVIFDREYITNAYNPRYTFNSNFLSFNSFGSSYAIEARNGVPLVPTDARLQMAQFTSNFADLELSFGYSTQTQQMLMNIWFDNQWMAYSIKKDCLRIF